MTRLILAALAILFSAAPGRAQGVTPDEARAIAKEATVYGFPMVDNYRILHSLPRCAFIGRSPTRWTAGGRRRRWRRSRQIRRQRL